MEPSPDDSASVQLCSACEKIHWHEPDIDAFAGSILREESIHELVLRSFCSFCRLIMHLLSPTGADGLSEWARTHPSSASKQRYEIAYQDFGTEGRWNKGTRTIAVRSNPKGFLEFMGHIYEVERHTSQLPGQPKSLDLGNAEIQREVLLSWIGECEKEHLSCGNHIKANREVEAASIRLIDVVDKKVIDSLSTSRYIALSYVWGDMSLLPSNWREVALPEDPGGFPDYLKKMPQTMQDAVEAVLLLGERYLWIDFVCIPQNDAEERQRQIQQMDLIYNHAYLTIVAASGSDAGFGLPGVRRGSRSSPRAIGKLNSVELIAEPEDTIADRLPSTTYETRGWTFQERILSSRCLFFTEKMIMFQCQTRSLTEISSEDLDPQSVNPFLFREISPVQADPKQSFTQYEAYTEMAGDYTKRVLSYRSDMLNAYTGITSSLTRRGGGQFFYGLPERFFDSALLWHELEQRAEPSAATTNLAPDQGDVFPSWSWASSKGPIIYDLLAFKESSSVHSSQSPILDSQIPCFEIEDENGIREIVREIGLPPFPPDIPGEGKNAVRSAPKSTGILHFKAPLVPFEEFEIDTAEEEPFYTTYGDLGHYTLRDDEGDTCGFLFGMPVPLTMEHLHGSKSETDSTLAWIQLSSVFIPSETVMFTMLQPFQGAPEGASFADKYEFSDWSIINVMLIRYSEGVEGVAERVGVAQMFQRAWDRAGPTECFIELA